MTMSDHPQHVWYVRADGTIGCAITGCTAEPTELEAAEVRGRTAAAKATLHRWTEAVRESAGGFVFALLFALLLAAVLLAVATWFGVDEDYRKAVLPTIAGVLFGVPFAVWFYRLTEAERRKGETEEAERRRDAVLSIIDDEVKRAGTEICGDRYGPPRELYYPLLPVEAWAALSASGELRWIEDANLLARIANAYHRIATINEVERSAAAFYNDPVTQSTGWADKNKTPGAELMRVLVDQDPKTIDAINDARSGINDVLRPGQPHADLIHPSKSGESAGG